MLGQREGMVAVLARGKNMYEDVTEETGMKELRVQKDWNGH